MHDFLYPEIQPYSQFFLAVTNPHNLYVEECGNPDGLPIIFIHGGPGAGCSEDDRRFFDPSKYRIVLFDQRGCGRSKPLSLTENNTTQDLINDIERIREQLGIEQWVVFGGSWGSTLSLTYAQHNPNAVLALVLRGIFLGNQQEIDYLNTGGPKSYYPEEFLAFKNFIATDKQNNLHQAYLDIMQFGQPEEKLKAAENFVTWDMRCVFLDNPPPGLVDPSHHPEMLIAEALIQCHYMVNSCFLKPGQLIENASKISHIPTTIVHGRYDMLCAPKVAFELHQVLPNSELFFSQKAGHSSRDEGTGEKLVEILDKLATSIKVGSP